MARAWLLFPVLSLLAMFPFVLPAPAQSPFPAVDPFRISDSAPTLAALTLQTDGKVITGAARF
jgi:hypothetical protein